MTKASVGDLMIVDPTEEEKQKANNYLFITRGSNKGGIYSVDFSGSMTTDEFDKVSIKINKKFFF